MRRLANPAAAILLSLMICGRVHGQPPSLPALPPSSNVNEVASPPPTYTIALQTRNACVTPHHQKLARAEGGFIDVTTPSPSSITALMTGTVAANSYLCCTGTASETFQLIQEFEITCSDPDVQTVALTLDTSLIGFVRSKGRAGDCVRRAEVSVTPMTAAGTPLAQSYPSLTVEGTNGQLCNQHLPPIEVKAMPVGRYSLVATFVLDSRAGGVCDSHAVADFSPDTALPRTGSELETPSRASRRSPSASRPRSPQPPHPPAPPKPHPTGNARPRLARIQPFPPRRRPDRDRGILHDRIKPGGHGEAYRAIIARSREHMTFVIPLERGRWVNWLIHRPHRGRVS